MHVRSTSRLVTVAVFVLSYQILEQRRRTNETLIEAIKASNEFVAGSDLLTSSIRAYAATGERQY